MGQVIREWVDSLLAMIYPNVCEICGTSLVKGESVICSYCNLSMPRTLLHHDTFNIIHQRLFCHCPIERASAMFYYYKDDSYAKLIHRLKYNHRTDIGKKLGFAYATELMTDNFFDGIDLILPIPIHWTKRLTRGYNQTEMIAEGISQATSIAIGDHLSAMRRHQTQTRKGALERWKNSEGIYTVRNAGELTGLHVLLIDDVITTGATMIHCCEAIHSASPSTRVSVLSLGATKLT